MTGSLHVKKDKYYMVINYYQGTQRKQKWVSTGLDVKGNKKKAERMLTDTIRRMEEETEVAKTDETLADTIRSWLASVKIRVDIVTYHGYKDIAESHVIPYFEARNVKTCDVDRRMLQRYINEKADHGRIDGSGGLSASSLRLHKNVLYQTCKYAVSEGILSSNPCDGVALPKKERINYSYYSASQISQLLSKAKDDVLFPIIKMTAVYGLRRSEVLGIQWDAIDFEQGLITIKHTVTKVYERVEKDKTKNKSSYRSYPMMPDIRDMLSEIRDTEMKNREDFGDAYHESPYVFKWPDGTPFDPDYITHHFSALLKKYDMPHIRFHELRHSCASILIVSGMTLKDVQEWLGHSNIEMTADIYAHLDIQRKENVGSRMMKAISF